MKADPTPVNTEKYYARKTIWDLTVGTVLIPRWEFNVVRAESGENRLVRVWRCRRCGDVTGDACRQCFLSDPVERRTFLSRPLCKESHAQALAGSGTFQVVLVDLSRKMIELSIRGADVSFSFDMVLMLVNSGYLSLVERKPVEF